MKTFGELKQLHIEISSMCNARCPGCPRNYYGFPQDASIVQTNLTLAKFKTIVSMNLLQQLEQIWFNGNYGDFVMNDEGPDIVEYVLSLNPLMDINISTNGSARNKTYWERLGHTGVKVWFCLDGLEDTHSLYRQDTNFNQILKNAQYFQSAGGKLIWQYTIFDHNSHQIEEARELSKKLNFTDFVTRTNNRGSMPVYNRKGEKVFSIGSSPAAKNASNLLDVSTIPIKIMHIRENNLPGDISCESLGTLSAYISATGDVWPCCYLAFEDKEDGIFLENGSINASTEYFPLVQEKWKTIPHKSCKHFCSKKSS